jgi:hypothetical protein
MALAGPGWTSVSFAETPVRPGDEKRSRTSGADDVIARFVKVATPSLAVFMVTVPARVAGPPFVSTMIAVIGTPASRTAAPLASRSWILGWMGSADPFGTTTLGAVMTTSWVAGSAPTVTELAAALSPGAEKVS